MLVKQTYLVIPRRYAIQRFIFLQQVYSLAEITARTKLICYLCVIQHIHIDLWQKIDRKREKKRLITHLKKSGEMSKSSSTIITYCAS